MTEIREGMQDASLSRRDFLKAAAGAVVVAAAAGVALPDINASKAFAASAAPLSGAYAAPGTYTVTANLYVDKRDSPIGKNAYVTNPGNPPFNKPTSPVANNATLVVAEGGAKLLTHCEQLVRRIGDRLGLARRPGAHHREEDGEVGHAELPVVFSLRRACCLADVRRDELRRRLGGRDVRPFG